MTMMTPYLSGAGSEGGVMLKMSASLLGELDVRMWWVMWRGKRLVTMCG